jgi:hypothetical protein
MAMRSSDLRLPSAVARASWEGSKLHFLVFSFEWQKKEKDVGDVRGVFEETFDVVHGDEGGG